MAEMTQFRSDNVASFLAFDALLCSSDASDEPLEDADAFGASTRQLGCSDDDEIEQACRADDAEDG